MKQTRSNEIFLIKKVHVTFESKMYIQFQHDVLYKLTEIPSFSYEFQNIKSDVDFFSTNWLIFVSTESI